MLSVSACWQKQYSEELFYLGGKVIFFFFPLSFHMSVSSGSTLFRFIPQGKASGSAVLVVTGFLSCPTGNFDH